MEKLTTWTKLMLTMIAAGSTFGAVHTYGKGTGLAGPMKSSQVGSKVSISSALASLPGASGRSAPSGALWRRAPGPLRVALSQWPGHMALLFGAGGLKTRPGSIAAAEGLDLEIRFIEDAPTKNEALRKGEVDFVWQTVDELPISLGGYRSAGVDVRVFIQIDWSRGGDACIASKDVATVESVYGRKSAMLMFSPDHTVFEFMINNSRLTPAQVTDVRGSTKFSLDDPTYARTLFKQGKVDVACLWEPDVTLALEERPGSHRLFSTGDATELVADVLLARQDFLQSESAVAEKLARVWFKSVERANLDRPAAANLIATVASRFRDELGYDKTLKSLSWARWTELSDNARFFGLDGSAPAFDRVYNQADSIWVSYPEAAIKDRFVPAVLRNDAAVRSVWLSAGKPAARNSEDFNPAVANLGAALFTKPVSINFPSNGGQLSAEALAVINRQILPQLEIAGGMSVRVEGNTDGVGERSANQALSEKRAAAIVEYLISRGVPRARLVARGNGSSKPVALNTTAEGRAQNRRTDVLFIHGAK
ncbi:MAG TPA: phosphate ABC transporter substrate-binding/OmpA family protein [Polyangiaceae bacterium]|nr:phosphate ABC transporter substrate-binding/OmpA family protein [Polyangiaceae bacterium]